MSKHGRGTTPGRDVPATPRRNRAVLIGATVVLAIGIVAALFLRDREPGGTSERPASLATQGARAPAVAFASDSGFRALNGRWLRPDGGYILEIRAADTGGAVDAIYLNPRPINVARAEVTREGSVLRLFVELRAPNYPGSAYTLTYDPRRDELAGTYFQAALRQRFDVVFVRLK